MRTGSASHKRAGRRPRGSGTPCRRDAAPAVARHRPAALSARCHRCGSPCPEGTARCLLRTAQRQSSLRKPPACRNRQRQGLSKEPLRFGWIGPRDSRSERLRINAPHASLARFNPLYTAAALDRRRTEARIRATGSEFTMKDAVMHDVVSQSALQSSTRGPGAFTCEIDSVPDAEWENVTTAFTDLHYEQTACFAVEHWNSKPSHLLLRDAGAPRRRGTDRDHDAARVQVGPGLSALRPVLATQRSHCRYRRLSHSHRRAGGGILRAARPLPDRHSAPASGHV